MFKVSGGSKKQKKIDPSHYIFVNLFTWKLFYRIVGDGYPLVILHGLFGLSDNWQICPTG